MGIIDYLSSITNALLLLINSLGYVGIFIGMAVESSFFPFPSEIILIPAGALIAQGKMALIPVFIASILGSIVGSLVNYYLALTIGRKSADFLVDKYGKFLFLDKEKLAKTDLYFKKHGEIIIFVGRLIPIVRQEVSLPAGFAKMHPGKFILFTVLGAGTWTALLVALGYFFGSNAQPVLKIVTAAVIAVAILIVVIYYYRQRLIARAMNREIAMKAMKAAERKKK